MATHKIITTDADIDLALEQVKEMPDELLAVSAEYKAGHDLDMLILKLSDGSRRLIPRENIEGLQDATRAQIAHIEIIGHGTGIQWPELDLDLYVSAMLQSVYGSKRWMAQLGRRGGMAKSPAKSQAARANGLKGGRPKLAAAQA